MTTQTPWTDYMPKQSRRPQQNMQMQAGVAGQVTQREISVTADSPPTGVQVLDANGVDIATIPHGKRSANFRGRGDISAIIVTVNGISRSCDLQGLDWLDGADDIGVTTSMRGGEPRCTLEDMSETVMSGDIFAQMPGNRCVYMSDQRGQSGMVCEQIHISICQTLQRVS